MFGCPRKKRGKIEFSYFLPCREFVLANFKRSNVHLLQRGVRIACKLLANCLICVLSLLHFCALQSTRPAHTLVANIHYYRDYVPMGIIMAACLWASTSADDCIENHLFGPKIVAAMNAFRFLPPPQMPSRMYRWIYICIHRCIFLQCVRRRRPKISPKLINTWCKEAGFQKNPNCSGFYCEILPQQSAIWHYKKFSLYILFFPKGKNRKCLKGLYSLEIG